ncbi:ABC transporter permease, partial [Streptomyces sp. NPDC093509]
MTTTPLPYRVTPARVLRSEWHKLWTLRSTWINLAVTSLLTAAMGAGLGAAYDGSGEGGMDPVMFTLLGTQFATVNLGVLGILATAGEYSTGQIRATMTAVPRRLPVLYSKAAVLTAIALPLTLATNLLTFPLARLPDHRRGR